MITICGDIHSQSDNKDYVNQLFDEFERLGHNVIILGDTFHYKRMVQSDAFNLVFKRLQESKLQYTILVGNHDWFNEDCKEHSLEPLKVLPNVLIVDKPLKLKLHNTVTGLIPYCGNLEQFRDVIREWAEDVHLLFIHQGVNNFDFGTGHVETCGINLEELEDFPLVIGGHLHKHQKDKNLVLLGTPKSHSHGEENQDKYLGLLDFVHLDLTYIPTSFPRHITLHYNCDTGEGFPEWNPINHNRCILTGTEENVANFDRTGKEAITFIPMPNRSSVEIAIKETDSNEKKFVTWATEIKMLDEATINAGLRILKDVQ